jgi:manganese efflux pump family protein
MFSIETALMGIALALDAAVVSFAIGLLNLEATHHLKISRGLAICMLFGFFQFLMVWLGSLGGYFLSFSSYGHLFQLIVATIFLMIGLRVFQESMDDDDEHIEWGFLPLLILAVATSIDALAAGVSLGTIPMAYLSAIEIGIITFFICALAYVASNILSKLPTNWLLRSASAIFFFLGGRILFDYFF